MELFCGGSLPLLRKYPNEICWYQKSTELLIRKLPLKRLSRCFEGRRWKPKAYTPIEENEIQIKSESASAADDGEHQIDGGEQCEMTSSSV